MLTVLKLIKKILGVLYFVFFGLIVIVFIWPPFLVCKLFFSKGLSYFGFPHQEPMSWEEMLENTALDCTQ